MIRKILVFAAALAMFTAISGCGSSDPGISENSISEIAATENTAEQASETEEPSEEKETEAAETETESADFSSIDGDWCIDGDYLAAHISISSAGTFTAYYASGNIENTGYIKYEAKENDGFVNYWYMLYTDDDEPYMGFIDDGSERKLDFYTVNEKPVHYVWISGIGGIADDGRGEDEICASEKYVGTWGCGRATLTVSENDDGTYLGIIDWADSAFAYVEWVYTLTYDTESQSMVCNGSATKTYYTYENENSLPLSDVMYTDGSGSFYAENDILIWNDEEENCGEDMEFVRSQY
ncbi:MAG: hypothetical protein ACI4I9_05400 [Porcipelethomonas sp.]